MATFFRFLHGNLLENTSTLARQQQSETTTTNFPFFSRSKHFLSKTNHNFKRCNQNGNVFTLLERKCAYCFPNNEMEWARMSTQKKIVADKLVYHKQRWLIRICRNYRRKIYSQEPLSKRWVNGEIISICFVRQIHLFGLFLLFAVAIECKLRFDYDRDAFALRSFNQFEWITLISCYNPTISMRFILYDIFRWFHSLVLYSFFFSLLFSRSISLICTSINFSPLFKSAGWYLI